MRVYFVRHGQSELNATKRTQLPNTPLSSQGLDQAKFVADRFLHIPIEVIITSPMQRALQTATTISTHTGSPLETNDLFIERRPPSQLLGLSHDDPMAQEIRKAMRSNFNNPDWHYSDEENYTDLKSRAAQALDYLATRKEESILVVSHGNFIRTIIPMMAFGNNLTSQMGETFMNFLEISNTGITMCDYHDQIWHLQTWNDYAHLG